MLYHEQDMTEHSNQDEINQAEWENPDNWTTIYFSKKDSRVWVPKQNPRYGWTINFGSVSGAKWIYYLFGLFLLIGIILGVSIVSVLIGTS